MRIVLDPSSVKDYSIFLRAKSLPKFRCRGHEIDVPDEYAAMLGVGSGNVAATNEYKAINNLFDYQRDITRLAIRKRKFAIFADCGLGKTMMLLEYVRHVAGELSRDKKILIVSPLMVVGQTISECTSWYGNALPIERVAAKNLSAWMRGQSERIGITNYDALTDEIPQGDLGALILDESSMLKSHYGKWGTTCLRLGEGLTWKLALTGTPAPNDRIEYANHAVFLDAFPTVNAFLARYFVNKGQTQERWVLKPHALGSFYRDISHWCMFLTNPKTYGWKDNCENIPPIHVHIHEVDLTDDQREAVYDLTGKLFLDNAGGITKRAKLSRIGKGNVDGKEVASLKPAFIKQLVGGWAGKESTIIWCHFNDEQKQMEKLFPDAASISGDTPDHKRETLIEGFKSGDYPILISKGKILGFGLNLQIATRQVFSGLQDSYESFYQCVKRSNRIGSTLPLNVHIPVTEIERPMIDSVLVKAGRVQRDTEEQERIFKEKGASQWAC